MRKKNCAARYITKGNGPINNEKPNKLASSDEMGYIGAFPFRKFPSRLNGWKIFSDKRHPITQRPAANPFTVERRAAETNKMYASIDTESIKSSLSYRRKSDNNLPEINSQAGLPEKEISKESLLPIVDNFLVEKCKFKTFYNIDEIHRNVYQHSKLGSSTQKPCKDVGIGPVPSTESHYSLSRTLNEGGNLEETSKRRKKKIVIKMPRTDDIYSEDSELMTIRPIDVLFC